MEIEESLKKLALSFWESKGVKWGKVTSLDEFNDNSISGYSTSRIPTFIPVTARFVGTPEVDFISCVVIGKPQLKNGTYGKEKYMMWESNTCPIHLK